MSDPNKPKFSHDTVERKVSWLGIWIVIVIAVGGLVEIVPLYLSNEVTTPAPGVKPLPRAGARRPRHLYPRGLLQLPLADDPAVARRDRALRPLFAGRRKRLRPSFQFGSKRTDRIWRAWASTATSASRASGESARRGARVEHAGLPWLVDAAVHEDGTAARCGRCAGIGVPYSDEEIARQRKWCAARRRWKP